MGDVRAPEPADPFAAWGRQLTPDTAREERSGAGARVVIGALAGLLLAGTAARASAVLILDQVFGTAGPLQPTGAWYAVSGFGAAIGGFIAYAWPSLSRLGKRLTILIVAVALLGPSTAEYIEARTGHLSYGELHQVAQLGGRSVCQQHLPAHGGWPAGTYWMLDAPANAGTPVTSHGGDRTWLHRYPAPLVCLN